MVATPVPTPPRPSLGDDARAVLVQLAYAALAASLVGIVVGGVLGRIVMFLLRVLSPAADGVVTDDGFEVGKVTLGGTIGLAAGYVVICAVIAFLYVFARRFLPRRGRIALWAAVTGAIGGATVVQSDGVDFYLLEPLWFAVATFVLMPALAGLGIAWLVERWVERPPDLRGIRMLAAAPALLTLLAAPVGAAVLAALVAIRRVRVLGRLADSRAIQVLALAISAVVVAAAAVDVVDDVRRILELTSV